MRLQRTAFKVSLLTAAIMTGRPATTALPTPVGRNVAAIAAQTYYPEIRLRKVHLVRPDLIFYPLDYEIFC